MQARVAPSFRALPAAVRRADLPALSAFGLGFTLVAYLGFKGGGYDGVVRGEVGIAVWWIVIIGCIVGVLPLRPLGRAGWAALGLLVLLVAWTALSLVWSESAERTIAEVGRLATYAGVLALALAIRRDRETVRRLLGGVGAAVVLIATAALLSRVRPEWFPANETAEFLPGAAGRLSYPINYWNGLAALVALALPLLLGMAYMARTVAIQALSAAALPVLVLCGYLTYSRGGALAAAVGLIAFFVLTPDRLPKLATAAIAAGGAVILAVAASKRAAVAEGLAGPALVQQGNELLVLGVVVCAGVGLVQVGLSLAVRYGRRPPFMVLPPRTTSRAALAAIVTAALVAFALGLPGELSRAWDEFRFADVGSLTTEGNLSQRYGSVSGNGRYEYWRSSMDAAAETGIGTGAGTFQFWWSREGPIYSVVRNAHSLYFETLSELGAVGLALLVAFLGGLLLIAVARLRRAVALERVGLAAATAGAAAFSTSALVDWVWQLAVLPVAFMLLAAVLVGGIGRPDARVGSARRFARSARARLAARAAVAIAGLVAIVAIAVPLVTTARVQESQATAAGDDLERALALAETAIAAQPGAATPRLQRALVLEARGDIPGAIEAAQAATRNEPTNWQNWLILSRIQAENANPTSSLRAYQRAKQLNPHSPIFGQ